MEKLEIIHESLINGQRKQMAVQIDEYGHYDFWEDYSNFLEELYFEEVAYSYLKDAVISYHRIKNR